MSANVQEAAQQTLEAVPAVMRTIRAQLRSHRSADISVPQFRAMGYIDHNEGASLSDLACFIGLTLPSMSRLVDGLVSRTLVTRVSHSQDRRRICLSLTPLGREELKAAHRFTERYLVEKLAALDDTDLRTVTRAMQLLKDTFAQEIRDSLKVSLED